MTDLRLLYITTKDRDQARDIAQKLMERRLIACANILPAMESIYRWDDAIQNENEAVLILKTRKDLVAEVTRSIEELHTYETPCVLALSIESGSAGYLEWLKGETKR